MGMMILRIRRIGTSSPSHIKGRRMIRLKIVKGSALTTRSLAKKSWLVWCIMLITTSVYIGSSIYSPAIGDAAEYFGVSELVSVLGLSLFGMSIFPLPQGKKEELTNSRGIWDWPIIPGSYRGDPADWTESTLHRPSRYILYPSNTYCAGG